MKVLLVYPEFPETYWSFKYALAFEGKRSAFPPLGLLTISAMLPPEFEKKLVDMNIEELTSEDLEWADMVFASAMLVQKRSLEDVLVRAIAHGKKTVVGGPYVSTNHGYLAADHIFIGEVEQTLPEFLHDLDLGIARKIYKAETKPAITVTPAPDFGLIDLDAYSAMSIQYSRGCPFQCEFCDIIEIYGRVPRTKTNKQITGELDRLYDVGWRGMVFIVDDNFIGNKRDVKKLLPEIAAWSERHGRPFSFITEASVNLAEDPELLEMMRTAGFRRVFVGIETPVEESLRETHKLQNTKSDLLTSVRKIQSYGMEVMAGFIVGFDSDPDDIFERQVDFIRESAIPLAMVGMLTALPETQLWRRLESEGRLLNESSGNNTDGSLNFVPKMDPNRLEAGYRMILRKIYDPHTFYDRCLLSLQRVGQKGSTPKDPGGILHRARSFGRVAVRLGLLDSHRMEFWRFVRRALSLYRSQFGEAMTLAAMGYHFRKLTDGLSNGRPGDRI